MKVEDIRNILRNCFYNSSGNHLIADCPFCGQERHFYLNVYKIFLQHGRSYVNAWDCKKCGESGNIKKLLVKLQKLTLLEDGQYTDLNKKINVKLIEELEEADLDLSVEDCRLPIGFKRAKSDAYLEDRGFTKREFEKYRVGRTLVLPSFEDYVILAIEEGNKTKGYIGRSILSKAQIDSINRDFKRRGIKKKHIRYRNSLNTPFNKLLIGYDEIMFTTQWVILVEGFFDKVRVDQALELDDSDEIKCCVTFGKSISLEQIRKLQRRGVGKVILIQDPDALKETKRYSYLLKNEFEDVLIGSMKNDKDLGSSSYREIEEVFKTLRAPQDFVLSTVDSNKLRR